MIESNIYQRWYLSQKCQFRMGVFAILFSIVIYFYFITNNDMTDNENRTLYRSLKKIEPDGFLVRSPRCEMPTMNPFAEDVMQLFTVEKYEACSKTDPLSRIEMNWTTSAATLVFNNISNFPNISCCYKEITRLATGGNIDNEYKLTDCIEVQENFQLPPTVEFILVSCKSHEEIIYNNTHAIVREKPEVRRRINEAKTNNRQARPLSVLMLGIDSISRLNLIRAMPETSRHLTENGWFELQGYNKIGENTFPNIMAILMGYNETVVSTECTPKETGKLEKCPFIWSAFERNGYATAHGEDETWMSTFNYLKPGFVKPPTDYYLRPYMRASEKILRTTQKHGLTYCMGHKHSYNHVYDFAIDFATYYKSEPSFALFWTNTFSHNDLSQPSSMDLNIKNYLIELESRGVLSESMVVFFSDHGMRFGPVRRLVTGWLEERLPFIFIWLPEWFRSEHPEIVEALKINRNRLTNPYDLHITLKHVLALSQPNRTYLNAVSCPNCQSLFKEIPYNRTCEEASIAVHWCTCKSNQLREVKDKNDTTVIEAVQFVIEHINGELKDYIHNDTQRISCFELKLKAISSVRKAEYRNTDNLYDDYIIVFELAPSGLFESTVRHNLSKNEFKISGSVSRVDSYAAYSKCMKSAELRKFCHCKVINVR